MIFLVFNITCLLTDIIDTELLQENNLYADFMLCEEANNNPDLCAPLSTIKFVCFPGYSFDNKQGIYLKKIVNILLLNLINKIIYKNQNKYQLVRRRKEDGVISRNAWKVRNIYIFDRSLKVFISVLNIILSSSGVDTK